MTSTQQGAMRDSAEVIFMMVAKWVYKKTGGYFILQISQTKVTGHLTTPELIHIHISRLLTAFQK